MSIKRTKANVLKKIYYDINNPYAFTSIRNLYKAGKSKDKSLTLEETKNWLTKQDAYTKHAPAYYKFTRRKVLTRGLGDQAQADLISLIPLAKYNDGHKYIFTMIDCFSRYLYAFPIKSKTPKEIIRVLKLVLGKTKFNYLQTDDGVEFTSKKVQEYLKNKKIKWFSVDSDLKASIVERVNRTLKNYLYRYFTANNTLRYINVLPKLVDGYNNRIHSTTKIQPINVTRKNQSQIWERLYSEYLKKSNKKFKFKINDEVRISKYKKQFKRGYLPTYTDETFMIIDRLNTIPPTYKLMDKNNEILKGILYEKELVKTN